MRTLRSHCPLLLSVLTVLSLIGCSPGGPGDEQGEGGFQFGATGNELSGGGNTPEGSETETTGGEFTGSGEETEAGESGGELVECDCPEGLVCDSLGTCIESANCVPGEVLCAALKTLQTCSSDGKNWIESPCGEDQVCMGSSCEDPICEPGTTNGCAGHHLLMCNSIGSDWSSIPCPGSEICQGGECAPVRPNVILLVDTSGSMNWVAPNIDGGECIGANCPPWSFPVCDDSTNPTTRLGKVKLSLHQLLESESAESVNLALQRFPQVSWPLGDSLFGTGSPGCSPIAANYEMGLWGCATSSFLMTGDDGAFLTQDPSWFTSGITQIMAHPLATNAAPDLTQLRRWVDFDVSTLATNATCSVGTQCGAGPCLNGVCHEYGNPELRAGGGTPIGKSLFYAGEYLRHFALIEGMPCDNDSQCRTANHTCVAGQCHDPLADCRPNVIIAFTDGEETQNTHITDFFHPRAQAKRMRFGLGCSAAEPCVGGATCVGGVCRPPAGMVDENALVCENGGLPCVNAATCPDPCANWGGCAGGCYPASIDLTVGTGANRISDYSGEGIPITVHVVDASGTFGANEVIAQYGGGQHFSVGLDNPEELLDTLAQLLGDAKYGFDCGEGEEEP